MWSTNHPDGGPGGASLGAKAATSAAPLPASPPTPLPASPLAPPPVGGAPASAPDVLERPAREGGLRRLRVHELQLPAGFATGPGLGARVRFAVGQTVLGLGLDGVRPIRAWHRRFRWAGLRRRYGLLGAVRWVAAEPVRALNDARAAVAEHGATCRDRFGVPLATQRRQLLGLNLAYGTETATYYQFQLFRPERRRHAGAYVQQHETATFYRVLAYRDAPDDFLILEDKRRFEQWCAAHALPCTRTLAELHDGAVADPAAARAALQAHAGYELFSKLVDGKGGAGAHRWRWHEGGRGGWVDPDGRVLDADALLATLAERSREAPLLLQECLVNHPALAPVATEVLCTARLITARPPDGEPSLVGTCFRTGAGDGSTDNFSQGGIAVAVDAATGRLGTAVRALSAVIVDPIERHPVSGAAFAGVVLPDWDRAVALARRAHAALPRIGFVGWDVALTARGPVLVEGNLSPGTRLAQAPSGEPLGRTALPALLDAHLRRSYARRS